MSSDAAGPVEGSGRRTRTRRVDAVEERVLGALMEKEVTTPDVYPMTLKGLVTACGQRSNRDPVMDLSESEIADALERLRRDVLVWRSEGARVTKWEHRLSNRWRLGPAERAVMTLLMLRGPQTPGELRTRSARLHAFESVEAVEETLQKMAAGDEPLVEALTRQPGQRETRWRHLMRKPGADAGASASPDSGAAAETPPVGAVAASPPVEAAGPPSGESATTAAGDVERRIAELERRVEALEEALRELL